MSRFSQPDLLSSQLFSLSHSDQCIESQCSTITSSFGLTVTLTPIYLISDPLKTSPASVTHWKCNWSDFIHLGKHILNIRIYLFTQNIFFNKATQYCIYIHRSICIPHFLLHSCYFWNNLSFFTITGIVDIVNKYLST